MRRNLRTVRAYLLKEDFQSLWGYVSPYWAGQFLDRWCTRTMRSRLEPMKDVARMVRSHRDLILNWFRARGQFSSGVVEGFNGKGQSDHQTGVWVPHLRGTGSRFVSRTWRPCPNQNLPTDSADEASSTTLFRFRCRRTSWQKREKHRTRELAGELGRLLAVRMREMLTLSSSVSKRRMQADGYTVSQFEERYRKALQANVPNDAGRILLR